ncbi:MAG: hypothetical protein JHC67_08150 [Mycolicibacterium sp.]|nr:hypothetical protein [Mycolicibacterium sp.]
MPGRGDRQDRADRHDCKRERGDQQSAGWTGAVGINGGAWRRLFGLFMLIRAIAGHLVSSMSRLLVLD